MTPIPNFKNPISRRKFLTRSGMGMAGVGFPSLLAQGATPLDSSKPLAPKPPHFAPKARHIFHIFMNGGPSHVDTFDPKPELTKYHGKLLPNANLITERQTGAAFGSPFKFRQ